MPDTPTTLRLSLDLALAPQAAFDVLVEELAAALARAGIVFEPGPGGRVIEGEFEVGRVIQCRRQVASNVKRWDKVIIGIYTALLPVLFVLAGLDAGRFRWSAVPIAEQSIGWVGMALAAGLIFWTVATNTFLSRLARIQGDRGQTVVTSGPYGYIRHPMYLGIVVLFLGLPLALVSFYAEISGLLIGILFVVRTAKENAMLQAELAGYQEYARRVRYRLVPGVY